MVVRGCGLVAGLHLRAGDAVTVRELVDPTVHLDGSEEVTQRKPEVLPQQPREVEPGEVRLCRELGEGARSVLPRRRQDPVNIRSRFRRLWVHRMCHLVMMPQRARGAIRYRHGDLRVAIIHAAGSGGTTT